MTRDAAELAREIWRARDGLMFEDATALILADREEARAEERERLCQAIESARADFDIVGPLVAVIRGLPKRDRLDPEGR